jgi:hypothetical protein
MWCATTAVAEHYGLNCIELREDRAGLSDRPGVICNGGNSGHGAVGLAHQFGAARILLLGYDLQRTGGRSHWHGDHPGSLGNPPHMGIWIERFGALAADARALGLDIINCSRQTALTCFRRMPLELALMEGECAI